MRIVHCIDTVAPEVGGPSYYVRGMVSALRQDGYSAALATLDGSAQETRGWRGIYGAMRQADVVHLHGLFSSFACGVFLLAWYLDKPLIVSVHGQLGSWCLVQGRLKKALFLGVIGHRLLRAARAIVAISPTEKHDVEGRAPGVPVVVAEPGVPLTGPRAPVRRRPESEQLKALFIGRLHPKKRVDLLIRAIAEALRTTAVSLDIAGDGAPDYVAALKAAVDSLGISDAVRFHGFVDGERKRALFEGSDVFVLPSAQESFAVAVAEALSYGVPMVLSAGVDISGEVANAGAGIRLEVTSAETIAQALGRLADPDERCRMSEAGRAFAEERCSVPRLASALAKAYQLAVSR